MNSELSPLICVLLVSAGLATPLVLIGLYWLITRRKSSIGEKR